MTFKQLQILSHSSNITEKAVQQHWYHYHIIIIIIIDIIIIDIIHGKSHLLLAHIKAVGGRSPEMDGFQRSD